MTAQFDERSGADIFVLLEREDASKAAGWNSPLGEPASLPGEAEAAVPDGRGGIVFVTDTQIWWISEPSAEPAVIEQPGIPVHLVGLRYIDGEPEVLVLIGQKLIGYDQGINELRGMFDQVGGDVIDIDVDGDHAVLVVESEPGRAVELVTMSTGAVAELVPPIVADDPAAPTLAAISGSNIVVMFDEQPGQVFTTNGTNRGEVNLRIEDMGVSSVDLAGGQLLAAFGEAAMVTDIETGERYVPSTPNGWVIGAVWGASPEPAPPDLVATDRYRVNTGMVEADTADPYPTSAWGQALFTSCWPSCRRHTPGCDGPGKRRPLPMVPSGIRSLSSTRSPPHPPSRMRGIVRWDGSTRRSSSGSRRVCL